MREIAGKPNRTPPDDARAASHRPEDSAERATELERCVAERTAELEAALLELEAFSYSVSHDLRAPLRAINGFAQILAETERERLSDEGRVLLDRLVANTRKMGKLIDDVLSYSRAGRQPLKRGAVDLAQLAKSVIDELVEQFPAVAISVGRLPVVAGDAGMLRQVLFNLLHNACKFSAKQAQPTVSIEAQGSPAIETVVVRDNGAGFDMCYADKLFGMFQRMHGDVEFPGTGVGLAIVKRLIERHGGTVAANAATGLGAEFRVSLPIAAAG